MVFQQPNPFPMSIYDNVAYGPRIHGIKNKKELDKIVEDSLKAAALYDEVSDRLHSSALGLSGGQQQRVLLARALCASDKIILLDEPVTGLDPQVTQEFYGLLKSLNEQGMTIVMVSHDLSVLKYATHVLYLKKKVPIFMEKEMFIERYGKEIYND